MFVAVVIVVIIAYSQFKYKMEKKKRKSNKTIKYMIERRVVSTLPITLSTGTYSKYQNN